MNNRTTKLQLHWTTELQNFNYTEQPNCKTSTTLNNRTAKLQLHWTTELQNFNYTEQPNCKTSTTLNNRTAKLQPPWTTELQNFNLTEQPNCKTSTSLNNRTAKLQPHWTTELQNFNLLEQPNCKTSTTLNTRQLERKYVSRELFVNNCKRANQNCRSVNETDVIKVEAYSIVAKSPLPPPLSGSIFEAPLIRIGSPYRVSLIAAVIHCGLMKL